MPSVSAELLKWLDWAQAMPTNVTNLTATGARPADRAPPAAAAVDPSNTFDAVRFDAVMYIDSDFMAKTRDLLHTPQHGGKWSLSELAPNGSLPYEAQVKEIADRLDANVSDSAFLFPIQGALWGVFAQRAQSMRFLQSARAVNARLLAPYLDIMGTFVENHDVG